MADRPAAPRRQPRRAPSARPGTGRAAPPRLRRDCALFLDIDGTLLEFAAQPEHVVVDGCLAGILPALLAELGGALALVTGRTIADADRLFPGLRLPIAGQHGLERRSADGVVHVHWAASALQQQLRRQLEQVAARHPGLLLEDKGGTLALHYRSAPRLASYLHRIVRVHVAALAAGGHWTLQPGSRVLELRPNGRDKGTAIVEYLDEPPFRGRVPVFVGDDRTDEFGFAVVTGCGGWAIKVGRGATQARYRLPDVAAVRRWLRDGMQGLVDNERETP